MSDTVAQLVEAVLAEGDFDASEPTALKWLSRRQRQMCARSRCFRKRVQIGPTVASQATYAVPASVSEVLEVQVAGVIYDPGKHRDLADGAQGWLWLGGLGQLGGGLAVRDDDESGVAKVAIYPTPTQAGLDVQVYAVCIPPDLEAGVESTLVVPQEYTDALVNGAVATGLLRMEHRGDLAGQFEQQFNAACGELRRRTNRLTRGSAVAQIRVAGLNA